MKVDKLEEMLKHYEYDPKELDFIVDGFCNGFQIGYKGNRDVQMRSPNLKLDCGSPEVLWQKMMKEVQNNRFAGPFENIPFKNYTQSPVGLVPKGAGMDTRLIFHLSYPRNSKVKCYILKCNATS